MHSWSATIALQIMVAVKMHPEGVGAAKGCRHGLGLGDGRSLTADLPLPILGHAHDSALEEACAQKFACSVLL